MKGYLIYRFMWDSRNIEHIWKHGLEPRDVEDVVSYQFREERMILHKRHGERLMVKGRDRSGRRIVVYIRPINKHEGTWRCVTAWEEKKK